MWRTTCGLGSNYKHCLCHTLMMPCLCTNHMTPFCNNNVPSSSTSFLNHQITPENAIYGLSHARNFVNPLFHVENDREACGQMTTNEIDSWLLPNPCYNQIDHGSLNLAFQEHGQFDHHMPPQDIQVNYNKFFGQSSREGLLVEQQESPLMFSQGIQDDYTTSTTSFYPQGSLQPNGDGIIPEAAFGTMNLPREWAVNQFHFPPFFPGNLVKETTGIHSNSAAIPSIDTQQQKSRDDLIKPSQLPTMSRQERILRYLEKKKSRKYKMKTIYTARKMFARTRPRVRGRFAKSSKMHA